MDTPRVRVAVVSPQPIVASGLASVLARFTDRVKVVPVATHAGAPEPEVVLYDVTGLLEGDGADFDVLIDETAAVVLAVIRDLRPDLAAQALRRGADGYFSLAADAGEVLDAVESASTGWKTGDEGENPTIGGSGSPSRARRLGEDMGLTDREREVLALVARGLSNLAIGEQLYLSINTVKSYIRGAYMKIGARSRSEAVAWAINHGLAGPQ